MNKMTDTYTLKNGIEIPCLGFGTYLSPAGLAKQSVIDALHAGYRHIDTAFKYGNETDVGEGIRASGVAREDVWITTKHWVTERGYEKTIAAVESSLKNLGTDYMDMYLIHWPCVEKVTPEWAEVNADTWRGFEKMYKDGKIRAIGVCNFERKHLDAIWNNCEIPPMVNQIEFHPGFLQEDTFAYSKEKGMVVEAYYPLGSGKLLQLPIVTEMAEKYGKTPAQILIRFSLQSGALPMPKSVHKDRIISNTQVFDFELSGIDMAVLRAIPFCAFSGWVAEEAPADAIVAAERAAAEGK
ncbi:MAG: aldo/keto reductase [Oscillospiraceae bacterium]|nr:aldo/keto reductase [Oscillospiraceae bacterium]